MSIQFEMYSGRFVRTEDTVRGFNAILGGDCDDIPEQCFMMAGDIDEVYSRYKGGEA